MKQVRSKIPNFDMRKLRHLEKTAPIRTNLLEGKKEGVIGLEYCFFSKKKSELFYSRVLQWDIHGDRFANNFVS